MWLRFRHPMRSVLEGQVRPSMGTLGGLNRQQAGPFGPKHLVTRKLCQGRSWCRLIRQLLRRRSTSSSQLWLGPTRLKIHGTEFRIINDDSVEAVVQDPRGIQKGGR